MTNSSRTGSQPKLKVTNQELQASMPHLKTPGEVHVAAIGDTFAASNGEVQVPVLLVQTRDDARSASTDEVAAFARGWGSGPRMVRHIENFTPTALTQNKLKVGSKLPANFNLAIARDVKPFYPSQEPMQYPASSSRAGEIITSGGMPVYENTRLAAGAAEHSGLDLALDRASVEAVQGVETF